MSNPTVEFIVKARDEATSVIKDVAAQLRATKNEAGGLGKAFVGFAVYNQAVEGIQKAFGQAQKAVGLFGGELALTLERMDRTASSAGITVGQLRLLERVFKNNQLEGEDVGRMLARLNRAIGNSDPLLKHLGITSRNAFEAFTQLSTIFSKSSDAAGKQAIAMKLLGRGSYEVVGIMNILNAEVSVARDNLTKFGRALDPKTADTARKMKDEFEKLEAAWSGLKMSLAAAGAPTVLAILEAFTRWLQRVRELQQALEKLAQNKFVKGSEEFAKPQEDDSMAMRSLRNAWAKHRAWRPPQIGKPWGWRQRNEDQAEFERAMIEGALNGANLMPDEPDEARVQRMKAIAAAFHTAEQAAWGYLRALEKQEQLDARNTLFKQLTEAGVDPSTLPGAVIPSNLAGGPRERGPVERPRLEMVPLDEATMRRITEWEKKVTEAVRAAKALNVEVEMAKEYWRELADSALTAASIMGESLNGLWKGLQAGFERVAQGIYERTLTLKTAVTTVIGALVQEALALLARLAAAKAFSMLMDIFLPGSGTVMRMGGFGSGDVLPIPRNGVTININAMDRADIARSLTAPNGPMRAALATAGASRY